MTPSLRQVWLRPMHPCQGCVQQALTCSPILTFIDFLTGNIPYSMNITISILLMQFSRHGSSVGAHCATPSMISLHLKSMLNWLIFLVLPSQSRIRMEMDVHNLCQSSVIRACSTVVCVPASVQMPQQSPHLQVQLDFMIRFLSMLV